MNEIITLDLLAIAIVCLALLSLAIALLTSRKHPYSNLRKTKRCWTPKTDARSR